MLGAVAEGERIARGGICMPAFFAIAREEHGRRERPCHFTAPHVILAFSLPPLPPSPILTEQSDPSELRCVRFGFLHSKLSNVAFWKMFFRKVVLVVGVRLQRTPSTKPDVSPSCVHHFPCCPCYKIGPEYLVKFIAMKKVHAVKGGGGEQLISFPDE